MLLCDNHWKFWTFSILWNKFSEKRKPFSKNWITIFFLVKVLRLKTQHFHTKLPCQKPMLRQIEYGVQNGRIAKLLTNFFIFLENLVSVKEPLKSWFDVPITQMPIFIFFVRARVFFKGAISLWISSRLVKLTKTMMSSTP